MQPQTKDSVVRVKLKITDLRKKPTKNAVMTAIYSSLNLPIVRIFEQRDSFIITMRNTEEAEKIMTDNFHHLSMMKL